MSSKVARNQRRFAPTVDAVEARIAPSPIGPIVHDPTTQPIYLDPPQPPTNPIVPTTTTAG